MCHTPYDGAHSPSIPMGGDSSAANHRLVWHQHMNAAIPVDKRQWQQANTFQVPLDPFHFDHFTTTGDGGGFTAAGAGGMGDFEGVPLTFSNHHHVHHHENNPYQYYQHTETERSATYHQLHEKHQSSQFPTKFTHVPSRQKFANSSRMNSKFGAKYGAMRFNSGVHFGFNQPKLHRFGKPKHESSIEDDRGHCSSSYSQIKENSDLKFSIKKEYSCDVSEADDSMNHSLLALDSNLALHTNIKSLNIKSLAEDNSGDVKNDFIKSSLCEIRDLSAQSSEFKGTDCRYSCQNEQPNESLDSPKCKPDEAKQ